MPIFEIAMTLTVVAGSKAEANRVAMRFEEIRSTFDPDHSQLRWLHTGSSRELIQATVEATGDSDLGETTREQALWYIVESPVEYFYFAAPPYDRTQRDVVEVPTVLDASRSGGPTSILRPRTVRSWNGAKGQA